MGICLFVFTEKIIEGATKHRAFFMRVCTSWNRKLLKSVESTDLKICLKDASRRCHVRKLPATNARNDRGQSYNTIDTTTPLSKLDNSSTGILSVCNSNANGSSLPIAH